MLNIGRIGEHVGIQITNDQGVVTGEVRLTADTAHFVAQRIVDAAREIEKGQPTDAKAKPRKK